MRASGSPLAGNSNSGNSLSKPPRHPPGKGSSTLSQNAEAANQKKSQRDKSADGVIRSNTPPRRAADPGSKIDFDFASENWDSDSDSDEKPISSKPADDAPDSGNKNNSFDEDSDEGYNEITIRSRNDSRIGSSVKLSSNNSLAGNSISSSGNTSMQAGVYVDSNWLQEDFDND